MATSSFWPRLLLWPPPSGPQDLKALGLPSKRSQAQGQVCHRAVRFLPTPHFSEVGFQLSLRSSAPRFWPSSALPWPLVLGPLTWQASLWVMYQNSSINLTTLYSIPSIYGLNFAKPNRRTTVSFPARSLCLLTLPPLLSVHRANQQGYCPSRYST